MSKSQRRRRVLGWAVDHAIRSIGGTLCPRRVICSRLQSSILESLESRQMLSTTLYWDTDNASNLQSGDGTWSTTVANWSTNSNGTGTRVPWTDGADAVFPSATTSTSTITVGGNVNVHSVTFTGTGYAVTGGTLTLGTSSVTVGADTTITSVLSGSAGLTKSGSGKLTLSAANTLTGNVRSAVGILRLSNPDALRYATVDLNSADSGTLSFGGQTVANVGGLMATKPEKRVSPKKGSKHIPATARTARNISLSGKRSGVRA